MALFKAVATLKIMVKTTKSSETTKRKEGGNEIESGDWSVNQPRQPQKKTKEKNEIDFKPDHFQTWLFRAAVCPD